MPDELSDTQTTGSIINATNVKLAGMLPAYTRREGIDWDWVAEMPLYVPRGYRLITEVSHDGVLSVQRQKL